MARKGFKIVKDRKTELYIGFHLALKKLKLLMYLPTQDFYKDFGPLRYYDPHFGLQVKKVGHL